MSPRKIFLLCTFLAVVVFIVIYSALSSLLGDKEEEKTATVNDLVPVIEASTDIPAQTIITDDMIKAAAVPQNLVPQGAITDKSKIVGRPAAVSLFAGDMITDRKMYDTMGNGFSGLIPKGMRAISFSINDITGVSGFAKPGDKVDILLISDKDGQDRIASRAILKDVLLLAVNKTSMGPKGASETKKDNDKDNSDKVRPSAADTHASATPAIATVAVSPYEAAKLAASAQVGQLYLVLRPYDASNAESESVSYYVIPMPKAQSSAPAQQPQPTYAPRPQPAQPSAPAPSVSISSGSSGGFSGIEVIRGTNISRGN